MRDFSVVIVGGGIAGLSCANYLHRKGVRFLLLEAGTAVGGRVQTDMVEGYRLDRGFQVLQTHYPEAKKLLDYKALDLKPFESGAKISQRGGYLTMRNPFRNPLALIPMAFSSVGSLRDKFKILKLVVFTRSKTVDELLNGPRVPTIEFLQQYGFSDHIINTFFRPFFGGVFLEEELRTASNFFLFTFKLFFEGNTVVPAKGMQEIPRQLAANLPVGSVRVGTPVTSVHPNVVKLGDKTEITADNIVIATNPETADVLLNKPYRRSFNSTTCMYFTAEVSPLKGERLLVLNPNRKQIVHHMCIPSDISADYAPENRSLISVTIRDQGGLSLKRQIEQIKNELSVRFGSTVNTWRYLAMYTIPNSLTFYGSNGGPTDYEVQDGIYRCGDYLKYPSLNAAMESGREVAELVSA